MEPDWVIYLFFFLFSFFFTTLSKNVLFKMTMKLGQDEHRKKPQMLSGLENCIDTVPRR